MEELLATLQLLAASLLVWNKLEATWAGSDQAFAAEE